MRPRGLGSALLPVITAVAFAGSFVAAKYTTMDLGPLTTSLLRYLVALAFLAFLVLVRSDRAALRVPLRDLPRFALLGLFGIVGYLYFFFVALHHTQVTNTAIINASSPVVTAFLAAVFAGERLRPRGYLGVTLAVFGVVVLLSRGDVDRLLAIGLNRGDAFMLLSVLSWSVYALLVKRLSGRYGALTLTLYATLSGVILLVPLAWVEGCVSQLRSISTASIAAVAYMGVAASGIGFLLYNKSVALLGPTRTSCGVDSFVPVIVAGLAWTFFGEPISVAMVASTGLILLGLFLALAGKATEKDVAQECTRRRRGEHVLRKERIRRCKF